MIENIFHRVIQCTAEELSQSEFDISSDEVSVGNNETSTEPAIVFDAPVRFLVERAFQGRIISVRNEMATYISLKNLIVARMSVDKAEVTEQQQLISF